MLNTLTLETFKTLHHDYLSDISDETVIWRRVISNVDRWGEGEAERFEEITLKAQVCFNSFKVWPSNYPEITGTNDGESLFILIEYQYLNSLGFISESGNFNFNPSLDRFIIKGLSYVPRGDSPIGAVKDQYISYMIILVREPINTGDSLR